MSNINNLFVYNVFWEINGFTLTGGNVCYEYILSVRFVRLLPAPRHLPILR